jgi:hypothetical protein
MSEGDTNADHGEAAAVDPMLAVQPPFPWAHVFGWVFILSGIAGAGASLAMKVFVETPDFRDIANSELMNRRLVWALLSSAMFVGGIVLTRTATIVERLPVGPPRVR